MTNSPSPKAGTQTPYWCFISYRHADNKDPGRQWATWLHQQIETYEVPEDLVGTTNQRGQTIPERIFPVFRDEEELPADADLGSPIYKALDRSLFLLVLCSPQAVESTYVSNEIRYFKYLGRSSSVLAAMIEGEPNASWDEGKQKAGIDPARECFPLPLQFIVDDKGNLDREQRAEPIAADFRLPNGAQGWTSPEAFRQSINPKVPKPKIDELVAAYQKQCELARLKIIAGILGVPLGTLTQRDKAYQLEKERRRAKTFRSVATALGLLALAAVGAGVLAYLKRQEAVKNQKLAEKATITAVENQERAEVAEAEAKDNFNRAKGLLWEASYNAWSEAERSYTAGDPQAALAYLANGLRNAPENTGLLTFASCILGEPFHPFRSLQFDYPVANVNYTRNEDEIIVAELIYSGATRYSLWKISSVEKLAEAIVPTDTEITDTQKSDHPWLKFAPATRKSNNTENDTFEPAYSPCSMRNLTADMKRVLLSGEGTSWSHPFYNFEAVPTGYAFPNSAWATGYAWSPSGGRFVSSHGYIDEITEQNKGRVNIWDTRQTPGFALLPAETRPFADLPEPDDSKVTYQGNYGVLYRNDGFDVFELGKNEPLWKLNFDDAKTASQLTLFSEHNEALHLSMPRSELTADGAIPPASLKIERLDLATGKVIGTCTTTLKKVDEDGSFPNATAHPKGEGYTISDANILFSWNGKDPDLTIAKDLGPKDNMAWSGETSFLPDGSSLIFNSGRKLMLLSWPDLTVKAGPHYHETMISDLDISEDGTRLVSAAGFGDGAGSSGFVQLWSLPDLEPVGPRLHHANQVGSVTFLDGGKAFISSTESPDGSDIRIWDSKSALPLTNYLTTPPGTGQAFLNYSDFKSGDISIVTAKGQVDAFGEGTFKTFLATPRDAVPAWFYEHFLPLAASKAITSQGSLEAIPPKQLSTHYKEVQAKLGGTPDDDDLYLTIARWYLANPSGRTLSPFVTLTLDQFFEKYYFEELRNGKDPATAKDAYGFDAGHPLLHLHLALNEKNAEKRLHYLRFGYYRLSRPENADIYGKEAWHEQMRTGQKLLTILKQPAAIKELEKLINGEE